MNDLISVSPFQFDINLCLLNSMCQHVQIAHCDAVTGRVTDGY